MIKWKELVNYLSADYKRNAVVLTVLVKFVRCTPFTPKRRFVQSGAANLEGVLLFGLQIQRQPRLSRDGHHLDRKRGMR